MTKLKTQVLCLAGAMALFLSVSLQAQVSDRLRKMQETFGGKKDIHLIMEVKAFENSASKNAFYNQKIELKKKGGNTYYKMGDNETLSNEKFVVWVDHLHNRIAVQPRENQEDDAVDVFQATNINMDSLMKAYESVKLVGTSNGLTHFSVSQEGSMIKKIDFYLDSNDLPRKMTYLYDKELAGAENLVEIKFSTIKLNPRFDASSFSEKKYISKTAEGYVANRNYANYRVIITETE